MVGNGKTIELVRKLTILEIILTILPIALVFIGGAIGGACGGASAVLVATFIRKQESVILKILVFLAILGLAVAAWLFLSSLYLMAFGN